MTDNAAASPRVTGSTAIAGLGRKRNWLAPRCTARENAGFGTYLILSMFWLNVQF
jgi:hypothetical protein